MFRAILGPSSGAEDCYSVWYNVPRLLSVGGQASDRQQSGDIIPHAVSHSLALLKMGKELPETC